jgi:3-methyladenine DNA glycosylase AlkD
MKVEQILGELKALGNPVALKGMARFGITTAKAYGVSVPNLRALAKRAGRDHLLAQQLWKTGVHEARILAAMVDDPKLVSKEQMERWARDFDSWDVVDGCCESLFDKTSFAVEKALEWSRREEEYVKRAGFVLMAELAVHDKKASDKTFLQFLPVVKREAGDERNFVRKAVNWALRQIGKRNLALNRAAVRTAESLERMDSKAARWIASDALRELTSEAVVRRLKM